MELGDGNCERKPTVLWLSQLSQSDEPLQSVPGPKEWLLDQLKWEESSRCKVTLEAAVPILHVGGLSKGHLIVE